MNGVRSTEYNINRWVLVVHPISAPASINLPSVQVACEDGSEWDLHEAEPGGGGEFDLRGLRNAGSYGALGAVCALGPVGWVRASVGWVRAQY